LIATHKARYIQTETGLSLGPGPFITALEEAARTEFDLFPMILHYCPYLCCVDSVTVKFFWHS
jgi:hypothetical protein